jgi:hypothetical protein
MLVIAKINDAAVKDVVDIVPMVYSALLKFDRLVPIAPALAVM